MAVVLGALPAMKMSSKLLVGGLLACGVTLSAWLGLRASSERLAARPSARVTPSEERPRLEPEARPATPAPSVAASRPAPVRRPATAAVPRRREEAAGTGSNTPTTEPSWVAFEREVQALVPEPEIAGRVLVAYMDSCKVEQELFDLHTQEIHERVPTELPWEEQARQIEQYFIDEVIDDRGQASSDHLARLVEAAGDRNRAKMLSRELRKAYRKACRPDRRD